jgi:hypothetical protein
LSYPDGDNTAVVTSIATRVIVGGSCGCVTTPKVGSNAMGAWRAVWQNFKKDHPNFEKNRLFKKDVGPNMDEYEKTMGAGSKCLDDLEQFFVDAEKVVNAICDGLDDYKPLLKELKNSDKSLEADYYNCLNFSYKKYNQLVKRMENIAKKSLATSAQVFCPLK